MLTAISSLLLVSVFFFFQAEDGIRDLVRSRGLGDVYKRQVCSTKLTRLGETPEHAQLPRPQVEAALPKAPKPKPATGPAPEDISAPLTLSLIHI